MNSRKGTASLKKSILKVSLIFNIIVIVCLFILLKIYPPLSSGGYVSFSDQETKKVVEIINSGYVHIKIKKVLVNGIEAKQVDLGVSTSNYMVMGGDFEDEPTITFHEIHQINVQPKPDPEQLYDLSITNIARHYGLRVTGHVVPEILTIHYSYFGIPFELDIDVQE